MGHKGVDGSWWEPRPPRRNCPWRPIYTRIGTDEFKIAAIAPSGETNTRKFKCAGDLDFPPVTRVTRIRRGRYDLGGALIGKDVVHAVTSLDASRASAADLAAITRGQRGIESVHWC